MVNIRVLIYVLNVFIGFQLFVVSWFDQYFFVYGKFGLSHAIFLDYKWI